jgi:hypothetical protein
VDEWRIDRSPFHLSLLITKSYHPAMPRPRILLF